MRDNKFTRIVLIVFIVYFLSTGIYTSASSATNQKEADNILIINSYHQGFTWTNEENNGIINQLQTCNNNINIMSEFMDWKNYSTEKNQEYLYNYFKYKYQNRPVDIIIATDDVALEFSLLHRKELFSDAPIVFSGVNQNGYERIANGYERVTGVIEVIDPTETIKIAQKINPSLKNIYLIYDNTESGISTGQLIIEKVNELDSNLNIISSNDLLYRDLITQVEDLGNDSIILISTYYRDVSNQIYDLDYVTGDVSKHSKVPVYHVYDFGLKNEIVGGVMLSGHLHGEHAAKLALQILYGTPIEELPISTPDSFRTVFDYEQLNRFGIPLDAIPKDSEIINKPFSFYETYKELVLGVLLAFVILLSFMGLLFYYLKKVARMKNSLAESHEELTQLYEELAASDEEMREHYEEMLVSNRKIREGEEKLTYLAYHDSMTGLPNKLSLYEAGKNIFREGKGEAALLFLDIDNFKYVNDSLGHAVGDELIVLVSDRLRSLMTEDTTIYRLSGDEFVIIMDHIANNDEPEKLAISILERFSNEFVVHDTGLHISMSIGIVMYPDHGSDLEQLLKYADLAMYRVKQSGRKNYMLFDDKMNQVFTERVVIEKHLQKALMKDEFELHYQPQLDLKMNRMTGFEALIRWRNPVLGNVSPLKFIPLAEETRAIIPIGTWVLKNACAFLKELRDKGYTGYTMSVNISMVQLVQEDFIQIVKDTLTELDLDPSLLILEITETMLMESFDTIIPRLELLNEMKVGIALDDFGKGYSSLNYLKQLPITTLKVDKSFIDPIIDPERDNLAGQIVMIGKSMGMLVVAEGVERQEQLDYLERFKCDIIQGYLYSRPISEQEILKLLEVKS